MPECAQGVVFEIDDVGWIDFEGVVVGCLVEDDWSIIF